MLVDSLLVKDVFEIDKTTLVVGDVYTPSDLYKIALKVSPDGILRETRYLDHYTSVTAYVEGTYSNAIEAHILSVVASVGYGSIPDATKYGVSPDATRYNQSVYFGKWMDDVYNYAEAQYILVGAGTIPMPTIDELISSLPLADAIPSR